MVFTRIKTEGKEQLKGLTVERSENLDESFRQIKPRS